MVLKYGKEAFLDISSIHEHATRSAVKGDLFVPRKQLALPSKQSQLQDQGYGTWYPLL